MILGGRLRDVLYESTDESSEDEEYNNGIWNKDYTAVGYYNHQHTREKKLLLY